MIKKRKMQIVLLCEDSQHEVFARNYLKYLGYSSKRIRPIIAPSGRGSGEQFIRKNYSKQVQTFRRKFSYGSGGLALIIVIDADNYAVQERLRQLDKELSTRRLPDEKIAIIVAKRNIETWIHYIRGSEVDEEISYRKLERESECKQDVKRLAEEICPAGLPKGAPPSLLVACEELSRIL